MIEIMEIVILVIVIATYFLCKDILINFISFLFPAIPDIEIQDIVENKIRYTIYGFIILYALLKVVFPFVEDAILSIKYRKEAKAYQERKEAFLAEINMPELLKEVSDIVILEESVKENYYHHPRSTENALEWGVYVGKFFLRCHCTVATFRCVKMLRNNGIPIKHDSTCIYEKEE